MLVTLGTVLSSLPYLEKLMMYRRCVDDEVEGKQLNVYVTGSGSKTLVLLAGGHNIAYFWTLRR